MWYWAEVYSPRAKRGRKKRRYKLFCEWRVLEVRTGFHTETMACVHPAAFCLLLSLPTPRLSICLWAETHGTSGSTKHASQKFTSCSSTLLLHTSLIPRTCINCPAWTQMAMGHTNRQVNASPLTIPKPLFLSIIQHTVSTLETGPAELFCDYLALSSGTDLKWQWKHFVCYFNDRKK